MGMGLSICRSTIEAHGGRLWATRCEPRVLSFTLRSPLTEPPSVIDVAYWQIVLQKSFCGMGLKFSEGWARRLNNGVGDHVATRQTRRRFWQRVCGSIERRFSLVSFFGENLAAAVFGTFATLSGSKQTCADACLFRDEKGWPTTAIDAYFEMKVAGGPVAERLVLGLPSGPVSP
jgi:hypothetical protein